MIVHILDSFTALFFVGPDIMIADVHQGVSRHFSCKKSTKSWPWRASIWMVNRWTCSIFAFCSSFKDKFDIRPLSPFMAYFFTIASKMRRASSGSWSLMMRLTVS